MEVGAAWYSLKSEDQELRAGLTRAEGLVTGAGTKAGAAGGQGISKGLGAGAVQGGNAITAAATSTGGKITGIFSSAGGKISGALKTQVGGAIAGLGAAFAASKIIGFFGDAIGAASQLEQSVGAVDSVFGESASTIQKFGDTAAQSFGLSRREVNELGAVLGAQLKGMGFETEAAAGHVITLQQRAADLAATFGGPTSQAVQAMASLLRGERDPIEQYGISIKEADVQARILALGLDTSTSAAQKNATATASLSLLMEQSASSAGAFGRESNTLAGMQARLGASMDNTMASIGEKLLPVMVSLATFANDVLVPALIGVIDYFKTAGENIGSFADGVSDTVTTFQVRMGDLGQTVENEANKFGLDVADMKENYLVAVNEMGLEGAEAMEYAVRATQGLPPAVTDSARQALANWKQEDLGGGIAADVAAGAGDVQSGVATGITEPTKEELEATRQAAEDAARATSADYASEIAAGADTVTQAWDALLSGAESEMSETARLADIEAKLAAPALTNALRSEDPYLRAQAQSTQRTLLSEYDLIQSGAIDRAVRTGEALPTALDNAQAATRASAMNQRLAVIREYDLGQIPASSSGTRMGTGYATGIGNQYGNVTGRARGVVGGAAYEFGRGNAYSGGHSLVSSWLSGMIAAWQQRRATIDSIAAQAGHIFGRSLPTAGPLKGGLRSGGLSVGESWTGGLIDGLRGRLGEAESQLWRLRAIGPIRPGVMPLAATAPIRPRANMGAMAMQAALSGGGSAAGGPMSVGNMIFNLQLPTGWRGSSSDIDALSRDLANSVRLRMAR